MSIATVSTSKLPFAIQTILGNGDEQCKISDQWERSISETNLPRKSCDKNCFPQYPSINSVVPYHFPSQSIKAAFEVTSVLPSINHCKFIHNRLLASGTKIQNYYHYDHFPFSAQYSPIRYGFASTSVAMSDRLAQSSKFNALPNLPNTKFGKLFTNSSNQPCFSFNSDLSDSKITKTSGNEQTVSHINLNHEPGGFCSDKNSSSFPIVIASFGSTTIGSTGSDSAKPQKTNRRNSSTILRRTGHSYQSRIPAGHKKPRTSFTKEQVCFLI